MFSVVQGIALEVYCAAESFALLFLNPPYDCELGLGESRRMEEVFLCHTYRWLKPGGILVLVIPGKRIADGTIIQREREYFTNELTLIYTNGKTAVLK